MKIPWWQRWLSHMVELEIESISSEYNDELTVCIVDGRYQLTTPTAIYSWADKYDNFRMILEQMDLDRLPGSEVLILGLGLGSIPYILERSLKKHYTYTGVEIDAAVIHLLSTYVLDDLVSDMTVVEADASSYVRLSSGSFDLVAMDVFDAHEIPSEFLTTEYLHDLDRLTSNNGCILFNMLAQLPSDRKASKAFYEDHFIQVFPRATCQQVKGNMMLISDVRYLPSK